MGQIFGVARAVGGLARNEGPEGPPDNRCERTPLDRGECTGGTAYSTRTGSYERSAPRSALCNTCDGKYSPSG
eukprot:3396617-Rhodomonas_salina.2